MYLIVLLDFLKHHIYKSMYTTVIGRKFDCDIELELCSDANPLQS